MLIVESDGHAPWSRVLDPGPDLDLTVPLTRPVTLVGSARLASGEPARGILVQVEQSPYSPFRTHTDAMGSFAVEGQAPGPGLVRFLAHGERDSAVVPFDGMPGEVVPVHANLGRSATVWGTAHDEAGTPLAHHTVTLEEYERASRKYSLDMVAERPGLRSVRTGEDGSFAFPACDDVPYVVSLFGPEEGAAIPLCWERSRPGTEPVRLDMDELSRPGSLQGHVRMEAGLPPEGAEVVLWSYRFRRALRLPLDPETGAFSVDGLPSATVELRLWCPDEPMRFLKRAEPRPGERLELGELRPAADAALRLLVTEADGSLPERLDVRVTGVQLSWQWAFGPDAIAALDGNLLLDSMPPEKLVLAVSNDNGKEVRSVELSPGQTHTVELQLQER